MRKIKLKKIAENLSDKLRKLFMNATERSSRNFWPSSSYRIFQAIFASPNGYFTESSRWMPLYIVFTQNRHWVCVGEDSGHPRCYKVNFIFTVIIFSTVSF